VNYVTIDHLSRQYYCLSAARERGKEAFDASDAGILGSTGRVTRHSINQIDYQNAGAALNKEMKKQVMARVDAAKT
jgi:hypothetical protein